MGARRPQHNTVHCGSLASVHGHMLACPCRVSASRSTPLLMLLFLAQLCKDRLVSAPTLVTAFARAVSSLSIEVVGYYLIALPIESAVQPARVVSRQNTTRIEFGEQGASRIKGSELASKRWPRHLQLCCELRYRRVYVRGACGAHLLVSRGTIVFAVQAILLYKVVGSVVM